VKTEASPLELLAASRVYKWLENTRGSAKIGVALENAVDSFVRTREGSKLLCQDGKPVDEKRCAGKGARLCRAGCSRSPTVGKMPWRTGAPLPREQLCRPGVDLEPIWSCDRKTSRVPAKGHPHEEAQKVLDRTTEAFCAHRGMRELFSVYLDCEFIQNYLHWTDEGSEWFDEAFVTYIAGAKDSKYEWQATNLVRSIEAFSSRPIILFIFDDASVPPASWHGMRNVIVFKMAAFNARTIMPVSFNFNKLRAMISARIRVGIQLDTDQIIAPGMDRFFEGTRREIHDHYPWPMLPVHWMSRDELEGLLYADMNFKGWSGVRTMRWGHAHPTWTFWALPFLTDLLFERYSVSFSRTFSGTRVPVWRLQDAVANGVLAMLDENRQTKRVAKWGDFMYEDEDMLNVGLWRDGAVKEWCKFDLEWELYKQRFEVDVDMMHDTKWYPDGVPLVFLSMHNTKTFESIDWMLSWIARCHVLQPNLDACPRGAAAPPTCLEGQLEERELRLRPEQYTAAMCCCIQPRLENWIFWHGHWFSKREDVPGILPNVSKKRTCSLP